MSIAGSIISGLANTVALNRLANFAINNTAKAVSSIANSVKNVTTKRFGTSKDNPIANAQNQNQITSPIDGKIDNISPTTTIAGEPRPTAAASQTMGTLNISKTLNQSVGSSFLTRVGKIFFGFLKFDNNQTNYGIYLFLLWIVYALIVFSTVSDLPYNQTKFTIYCCSIWFVLLALLFLFTNFSLI